MDVGVRIETGMDACVFDNNIVVALTNKPSKNRERLIWLGQLQNPMELSNQDDDETLKIIAVRRGTRCHLINKNPPKINICNNRKGLPYNSRISLLCIKYYNSVRRI
ncbi:hypothetical protein ABD71_17840 [Brevibacillus laterosporus]|nr:hypothetical protein [Brevibacillus laterosporus]